MANLRTKIYMLLVLLMGSFACAQDISAQGVDAPEDSPVIMQGIQSAEDGINYWASEKEKANDYWNPGTKTICLNMLTRSENEIKRWAEELDRQTTIGAKYVVHSASYWTAKKYLSWAYKVRDGVKELYERTKIKELAFVLSAMNEAIRIAEGVLKLFE
ncbi:MAG TPA: hypothetical protein PKE39_04245 [Ignavibacteria bacterium]|nr:hypothetical protein [Ignavibacteria bacterium]HMQ98213.1 hypothetical protein [Ignavibacteria bacterium]